MRVISKRGLFEKAKKFRDAQAPLQVWLETAKAADWNSLEEIRIQYPHTDMLGNLAIFNIKGGHYRLIVRMEFTGRRIFVKEFLTHAEYDKEKWKKWL